MNVLINTSGCAGAMPAVDSKSEAHRLLVAASLADGPTEIGLKNTNEDIDATVRCLRAIGAQIEPIAGGLRVLPAREAPRGPVTLDCGESGSTIRFLLPVAAVLGLDAVFTGRGSLPGRPQTVMTDLLAAHGVTANKTGFPIRVSGRLTDRDVSLRGDVSSQFVTGLMLAFGASGGGRIRLTTPLQSAPYARLTASALARFGVETAILQDEITVSDGGFRSPGAIATGGDWSNAAPWLCLGALKPEGLTVTGLDPDSAQGDRKVLNLLRKFGAEVDVSGGAVTVRRGETKPFTFDAGDNPDLVPVVASLAAFANGETRVTNAARLRIKESDRLASVTRLLTDAGISCRETPDGLVITGGAPKPAFTADACGDHRLVMAAAVLASGSAVTVTGAEAVNKSYPAFLDEINDRGGLCHVVHDGQPA